MLEFMQQFYLLVLDAAPWLVIGLLIGGVFKTLIPQRLLEKHLSQESMGAVVKATLLGAPLPLCSCGVIPAAMGLRKAGASRSATTSFLVSTPETGADSAFITYALLGPVMAIVRPIAALFSALVSGLLVLRFAQGPEPQVVATGGGCCGADAHAEHDHSPAATPQSSVWQRIAEGLKYTFSDLFDNLIKWLLIGLLVAAAMRAWVPVEFLNQWGQGWLAMLAMLILGIPMYVCATASTPIAAGFIAAGISPGAVLVYLLTGPATNIATLGVIHQTMGRRVLWLYVLGICGSALLCGWAVDRIFDLLDLNVLAQLSHAHQMMPLWIQLTSAIGLTALALYSGYRHFFNRPADDACCAN